LKRLYFLHHMHLYQKSSGCNCRVSYWDLLLCSHGVFWDFFFFKELVFIIKVIFVVHKLPHLQNIGHIEISMQTFFKHLYISCQQIKIVNKNYSALCCIKVEKVHTCLLPYLREKAFCFPSSIPW
jgi:hypothetical protein